MQLLVVLTALILWVYYAINANRHWQNRSSPTELMPPCFAWFGVLLMITLIGCEVSWLRIWNLHQHYGFSVRTICVSIIVILLFVVIKQWWQIGIDRWNITQKCIKTPMFLYHIIAACWMLMGKAFEEGLLIPFPEAQYYEELCEMVGYFTCLYAALSARRLYDFSNQKEVISL